MIKKFNRLLNNKKRCLNNNDINIEEMNKKISKNAVLLDVRSRQEYNEGHLKGAINIAEYEIVKTIEKIISNKDKEIIVYCQNGGRSKKAYKKLKKIGYKKVYNLCGGLDNYNEFII